MARNGKNKKRFWETGWWAIFSPIVWIVIGIVVGRYGERLLVSSSKIYVVPQGNLLSIYNFRGELIGEKKRFHETIDTAIVVEGSSFRYYVAVATKDGMIFTLKSPFKKEPTLEEGFHLLADSVLQDQTHSHRFELGHYNGQASGLGSIDWDGDGNFEIFAVGNDAGDWYPGRVVILDNDLSVLFDYWNPGRVMKAMPIDIDGDRKEELTVFAHNNHRMGTNYYGINYALLDSEFPVGQSPEGVYPCHKPGVSRWYLTWVGPEDKKMSPNTCEIEEVEIDGHLKPTVRITRSVGLIINIDAEGEVVKLRPDDRIARSAYYYECDTLPEPWLVKLTNSGDQIKEETIFLKEIVLNSGWIEYSEALHQINQ